MTVKEQMVRIVHDCENDTCETCQWFNGVVGCQEPKSAQILSLLIEEIKKCELSPEELKAIKCPDPLKQLDDVDLALMTNREKWWAWLHALLEAAVQAHTQKIIGRLEE